MEVSLLQGELAGRLVVLEPLSISHVGALVAAAGDDAELFRWYPYDIRDSMEAWVAAAVEAAAAGREVPFVIRMAGSGEVVGSTRFLSLALEHLRAEIGWTWVARGAWGRGVNVEAKLLLLLRAFSGAGLRRVEFKTDALNARSRGALEALGARFEGVFRKHMVVRGGAARDSAYYSVIDSEWPAVRAGLEARLSARLGG